MDAQKAQTAFAGAGTLFQRGDFGGALALLDQLEQAFPNTRRIMFPRARCLAKLGRGPEAVSICDALIANHQYQPAAELKSAIQAATPPPAPPDLALDVLGLDPPPSTSAQPPVVAQARGGSTNWTKVAVICVAIVAVAALALPLILGSGGGSAASAWSLIPGDVSVIGILDLQRLTAIPLLKTSIEEMRAEKGFEALETAGLGPENIGRVCLGMALGAAMSGGTPDGVAIIELVTPIDEAQLATALQAEDSMSKTEIVDGHTLYLFKTPGTESQTVLTVLSEQRVAVGTWGSVHQVVSLLSGQGGAVSDNRELMDLLRSTGEGKLLRLAGVLPENLAQKMGPAAMASPIQPDQVESLVLGIDYQPATGMLADLTIACATSDVAAEMTSELEGMSMVVAMIGLPPESLSVAQKGNGVGVSLTINPTTLATLAAQAKQMSAASGLLPQ